MTVAFSNPEDELIIALLSRSKTIAIVGLSPKKDRDSHRVAVYLKGHGYRIVPVYPYEELILGERVYRDLKEIPFPVDIVNVFRRSEEVPPVVMSSLALRPKAVWLQLGVINEKAIEPCEKAGITLIMNKCIMVEHRRLFGG